MRNGEGARWTAMPCRFCSADCFINMHCQEMQEDQQKQLSDMQENIGYYQKKAKDLEVT